MIDAGMACHTPITELMDMTLYRYVLVRNAIKSVMQKYREKEK